MSSVVCPGIACTSCFACVGAGGAAASALVIGFVSRKLGRPRRDHDTDAAKVTGGRSEASINVLCDGEVRDRQYE
jgi:hypothetical protein